MGYILLILLAPALVYIFLGAVALVIPIVLVLVAVGIFVGLGKSIGNKAESIISQAKQIDYDGRKYRKITQYNFCIAMIFVIISIALLWCSFLL